jgi:hypothetical protein
MRLLVLVSLFLVSCSRYTKLEGTYFSARQDCLVLDGKSSIIESDGSGIDSHLELKQKRNRLKFKSRTLAPDKLLFRIKTYRYNFKIHYRNADSFMVSPVSRLARSYFKNRDSIVFKTKYGFADPTNTFTRIVFHSGRCFGFCPDLHLELDYSGNLKVTDNGNGMNDTLKNDNYYGKVSPGDLQRLKNILKYSQLKTLKWPAERRCTDMPEYTLIVYQNEKRYYFKMNSACLPIVSYELTRFLRGLFKYETLKKTDTTFTYER